MGEPERAPHKYTSVSDNIYYGTSDCPAASIRPMFRKLQVCDVSRKYATRCFGNYAYAVASDFNYHFKSSNCTNAIGLIVTHSPAGN